VLEDRLNQTEGGSMKWIKITGRAYYRQHHRNHD
jgi:hypothetical protein